MVWQIKQGDWRKAEDKGGGCAISPARITRVNHIRQGIENLNIMSRAPELTGRKSRI